MNETYATVASELTKQCQELLENLKAIDEHGQRSAGKRARVITSDMKKTVKAWRAALLAKEAAYPKKEMSPEHKAKMLKALADSKAAKASKDTL